MWHFAWQHLNLNSTVPYFGVGTWIIQRLPGNRAATTRLRYENNFGRNNLSFLFFITAQGIETALLWLSLTSIN